MRWRRQALGLLVSRQCYGLAPASHSLVARQAHHARALASRRRVVCRAASTATITTLAPPGWVEEETVRKSRFVAHAAPASSWAEAKAFIADVSDTKARHNCWAWVGADTARSSDDGEPSGTAGRPILNAIEGEELKNVAVVVTRYKVGRDGSRASHQPDLAPPRHPPPYHPTPPPPPPPPSQAKDAPMLGAGGLLRAYGSAARLVVVAAPRRDVVPVSELTLRCPLSELGNVQRLVSKWERMPEGAGTLTRAEETYTEDAYVLGLVVVSLKASSNYVPTSIPPVSPPTPPNPTALRSHRIAIQPSRLPPQESAAVDRFVAEVTESSNGMAVAEPPEAETEEGS